MGLDSLTYVGSIDDPIVLLQRKIALIREQFTAHATFDLLVNTIHQTAVEKGWYEPPKTFTECIALYHAEISEALEEYRNGHLVHEIYFVKDKDGNDKPEGVPIELADLFIRVMDTCGYEKIDIWNAILTKMEYNLSRSHRHGNKPV